MRICIIGKYPPIQGGVSTQAFWMAQGLAGLGHEVSVFTNVYQASIRSSMILRSSFDDDPLRSLLGLVCSAPEVLRIEPGSGGKHYHEPLTDVSVTQLASFLTETVRRRNTDLIFAYYLEPYAVAAYLASSWTDVPFIVKHAGSDLYRLAACPELFRTYSEVLKRASLVLGDYESLKPLQAMGVARKNIWVTSGIGINRHFFNADAPTINSSYFEDMTHPPKEPPARSPGSLVIGIYGKLGREKGSFALLDAIQILRSEQRTVHLIAMAHGACEEEFRRTVKSMGLDEAVTVWPYVANTDVPGMIRRCDVVALLEHHFPIAAHSPLTPKEVIACGTCLMISEELARKQLFRSRMRNGHNILIVSDPSDPGELADHCRNVLMEPRRATRLGQSGAKELPVGVPYEESILELESIARAAIANHKASTSLLELAACQKSRLLRNMLPLTYGLLSTSVIDQVAAVLPPLDDTDVASAVWGAAVQAFLDNCLPVDMHLRETCRYELTAHKWLAARRKVDSISSIVVMLRKMNSASVPRLAGLWTIEHFDTGNIQSGYWRATAAKSEHTIVLFSDTGNPLLLSPSSAELIAQIGASPRSIASLAMHWPGQPEQNIMKISSVVEGLCWYGLLTLNTEPEDELWPAK